LQPITALSAATPKIQTVCRRGCESFEFIDFIVRVIRSFFVDATASCAATLYQQSPERQCLIATLREAFDSVVPNREFADSALAHYRKRGPRAG
jgi:hypothetical protein